VNAPGLFPMALTMSLVCSCAAAPQASKQPESPPPAQETQAGAQAPPPPPAQPAAPGPASAPPVGDEADSYGESEEQVDGGFAEPPPGAPAETMPAPAPPRAAPPPSHTPGAPPPSHGGSALLVAVAELEQAELRLAAGLGDCRRACQALASMVRSAARICQLDPPGGSGRCEHARERVAQARDRVREACGECEHGQ